MINFVPSKVKIAPPFILNDQHVELYLLDIASEGARIILDKISNEYRADDDVLENHNIVANSVAPTTQGCDSLKDETSFFLGKTSRTRRN